MSLALQPMGTLVIEAERSWRYEGDFGGRTCASFKSLVWTNDLFTAVAVWSNGTYRMGTEVGAPEIRALLRTTDGMHIYLEYAVRIHLPTHALRDSSPAKSPAIMSARMDVEAGFEDYRWLNRTQVVGCGSVQIEPTPTMTYDVQVLRWPGDTGPS
jgi:hypothetical protein